MALLVLPKPTIRHRGLTWGSALYMPWINSSWSSIWRSQDAEDLDRLLQELSWVRTSQPTYKPALYLSVSSNNREFRIPRNCREVLRTDDFLGFEVNDDFYLTDRSSVFHLRPAKGEGYARLAPSFFAKRHVDASKLLVFWFAQAPSTAGDL